MEPEVLAELVEHEPELPVTSGPDLPAAAVEAGTAAASAGTTGEAGTAAGTAGAAGVEDECCCRKQRGTIFLFLSSISKCLRSVLSALSTRWLKSSKRRLSSAYWR